MKKKEEIYTLIDSEEKRLEALEILESAGEEITPNSIIYKQGYTGKLVYMDRWVMIHKNFKLGEAEVSLEDLRKILNVEKKELNVITDNSQTLENLKKCAEALGYELIEKKREPKVGAFGAFYDEGSKMFFSFLEELKNNNGQVFYKDSRGVVWENFRYLTEAEKQKIQENW